MEDKIGELGLPEKCPTCHLDGKDETLVYGHDKLGSCAACGYVFIEDSATMATLFDSCTDRPADDTPYREQWIRGESEVYEDDLDENEVLSSLKKLTTSAQTLKCGGASSSNEEEIIEAILTTSQELLKRFQADKVNPSKRIPSLQSISHFATKWLPFASERSQKRTEIKKVTRKITFRAYIPPDVQKTFAIERVQVRVNSMGYRYESGEPLATLTKVGERFWEGTCWVNDYALTSFGYRYYVYDDIRKALTPEDGLKVSERRVKHIPREDCSLIFYDGTITFQRMKAKQPQIGSTLGLFPVQPLQDSAKHPNPNEQEIIRGFEAMQPRWIEEIWRRTKFEELLTWVDRAAMSQRPFLSLFYDEKSRLQNLKRWVKQDIEDHLKLLKDDNVQPLVAGNLFLSMLGLIYRAKASLDESEKEIIERLDKLIKKTMNCIQKEIGDWIKWLDHSIGTHKPSLLHSLEKVMLKMSDALPGGYWPYLIPISHYLQGYHGPLANCAESQLSNRSKVGFPCGIKSIRKLKDQPKWDGLLEPFMVADPLLSYSVMHLLNDQHYGQFLISYSKGKVKGNRLGAVLERLKTFVRNHNVESRREAYVNMSTFLEQNREWTVSKLGICWKSIPFLAKDLLDCFSFNVEEQMHFNWAQVQAAIDLYLSLLSIYQIHSDPPKQACVELENGMSGLWDFIAKIAPFGSPNHYYYGVAGKYTPDALILKLWENLSLITPTCEWIKNHWYIAWKQGIMETFHKLDLSKVTESFVKAQSSSYRKACTEYLLLEQQWNQCSQIFDTLLSVTKTLLVKDFDFRTMDAMHTTLELLCVNEHPPEQQIFAMKDLVHKSELFRNIRAFCENRTLSSECNEIIKHIEKAVGAVFQSICDSKCKISNIQLLRSKTESFLRLVEAVLPKETRVIESFTESVDELDDFITFHSDLSSRYAQTGSRNLCLPEFDMNVTLLELYDGIDAQGEGKNTVQRYNCYRNVTVFNKMLEERMGRQDSVVENIQVAYDYTNQLVQSLSDGTIHMSNLRNICNDYYGADVETLKKELDALKAVPHHHLASECLTLEIQFEKAKTLIELEGIFGCNVKSQDIHQIAELTAEELELKDLHAKFLEICQCLESEIVDKSISPEQKTCVEVFLQCEEFVKWVKENVDESAINTFVRIAKYVYPLTEDLAAKSTQLLDALTGYAPLIYHYDECKCDLIKLHRLCKLVWENMKTNHNLPDQLLQCKDDQVVLKAVGSDLCKSTSEANMINQSGIYEIGIDELVESTTSTTRQPSVYNVIKLRLGRDAADKHERKKPKSLDDLDDLESRLALIGDGDGCEDTFQSFKKLKEQVKKLAEAYLVLQKDGCIMFENIKIVVYCNPMDLQPPLLVDFYSDGEQLAVLHTEEKTNLQHCEDLHAFMMKCIEYWNDVIYDERRNWRDLNLYTKEQLVSLRKNLGDFVDNKSPESLAKSLPLLELLHDVPSEELHSTIKRCSDLLNAGTVNVRWNLDDLTDAQRNMFHYLKENFFGNENDDDIVDALVKFGDVEADESTIGLYLDHFEELDLSRIRATEELPKTMKDEILQTKLLTLQARLTRLWELLMRHTSKSIKGFLSLQHLGLVLSELRLKKQDTTKSRVLPQWLHRGRAALVGVALDQTYRFVVTLYSADESFACPTRNEVLVCNERTSGEEVELLITRALSDDMSCYCVVNCHLLDYDICQMIDEKLKICEPSSYALAFVYDEKKKCCMKTCLDRLYIRTDGVTLPDDQHLRAHLENNVFWTSKDITLSSDADRHYVRLMKSDRSGVGKTFECQNLFKRVKAVRKHSKMLTISIHKSVDTDSIVERLTNRLNHNECFIHIDISPEVTAGVDELLFNLLILRSLPHTDGRVWQTKSSHYYLVERTIRDLSPELIDILPSTSCISPLEIFHHYSSDLEGDYIGFNTETLHEDSWQLVLKCLSWHNGDSVHFDLASRPEEDNPKEALELLLKNCGCEDPSWAELSNFVRFLKFQLAYLPEFDHCKIGTNNQIPGLAKFLVKFLVGMAQDFATHSAEISEESGSEQESRDCSSVAQESMDAISLVQHTLSKKWEQHDYPYLFFKENGKTFDTLGFCPSKVKTEKDMISLWKVRKEEATAHHPINSMLYHGLKFQKLLPELDTEDFDDSDSAREKNCQKLREIMVAQSSNQQAFAGPNLCAREKEFYPNYVLTRDNAKKILAIYTRFTTNLPVVIMGETGCGKTMLIEFMAKLQLPTKLMDLDILKVVKVHGGTTSEEITKEVNNAFLLAERNCQKLKKFADEAQLEVPLIYTILFFDEANTTDEIGLIKEIMCDHRMNGDPLPTETTLRFIAACNPQRRMNPKMIEKLKSGGLGSRRRGDIKEKPGKAPLGDLVYRVHALPQSLRSLLWDFGTLPAGEGLETNVELKYIRGIIARMQRSRSAEEIQFETPDVEMKICELITKAQQFMRDREDECSFVSLRDVERLLVISNWFYKQREYLFPEIDKIKPCHAKPKDSLRSVMLGIGVCYISRLCHDSRPQCDPRRAFALFVQDKIEQIMYVPEIPGADFLLEQIDRCQTVFANEVIQSSVFPIAGSAMSSTEMPNQHQEWQSPVIAGQDRHSILSIHDNKPVGPCCTQDVTYPVSSSHLGEATASMQSTDRHGQERLSKVGGKPSAVVQQHPMIAQSRALKENLLMMVVCVDTRIPLFVIGKPGTSKSLANGLLANAMQGEFSKSDLFKRLKFMFQDSFQCSQHTTPEQIIAAYEQCRMYQMRHNPDRFVSVVLLDEIGLAEDSERNPLKTLHPLLESSCYGDKQLVTKCGFIGISNWALDPAKMNRGLYLHVSPPVDTELESFASAILEPFGENVLKFVPSLVKGYKAVCQLIKPSGREEIELFGLRDYYSLIKMLAYFAERSEMITQDCLIYCIKRCFAGIYDETLKDDSVKIFFDKMDPTPPTAEGSQTLPTDDSAVFKSSLFDRDTKGYQSRYLMALSESIGVLDVILHLFDEENESDAMQKQKQQTSATSAKEIAAPEVIFGSAFKDDVSYTQVCQNVYKIRMCMAKGQTVIVLNIDDLHECLYDLLNQSFYTWQNMRYVDLAIGIHRVPTKVHDDFRLILIADKDQVYSKFPIPLINRFEKHYIATTTFLDPNQRASMRELNRWMDAFEKPAKNIDRQFFEDTATSFIGHSPEMSALVIHKATLAVFNDKQNLTHENHVEKILEQSKLLMLQCATAESVLRLSNSNLDSKTAEQIQHIYTTEQKHENLLVLLETEFSKAGNNRLLLQVTTFAESMNRDHIETLEERLNNTLSSRFKLENIFPRKCPHEHTFRDQVREFCSETSVDTTKVLIVQCELANSHTKLLDSVRYILLTEHKGSSVHIVLLLSLTRGQKFTSYQGGEWICAHIDDPRFHSYTLPLLRQCVDMEPYQLINPGIVSDAYDGMPSLASLEHEVDPDIDVEAEELALVDVQSDQVFPDLLDFIKQDCLSLAVSIIQCYKDSSCDRVKELTTMLTMQPEFAVFTEIFLKHTHRLMQNQHELLDSGNHWIKTQAADARKMKTAETLRRSLTDILEEEFRPAIAAIIAFADPHRNLKLLHDKVTSADEEAVQLWLSIFQISESIGLCYEQGLPHVFKMFHIGGENAMSFTTSFPFSWKVKESMDRLMDSRRTADGMTRSKNEEFDATSLLEGFEQKTTIGKLLTGKNFRDNRALLESYMDDFIYLSHPFQPGETEHLIVKRALTTKLNSLGRDSYTIADIHVVYDCLKPQLDNMAAVLQLNPLIASDVDAKIEQESSLEMSLDGIALEQLVEYLKGSKDGKILTTSPEFWILQVELCKSFTETILGVKGRDIHSIGSHRLIWSQLEFKKLYVKHVILPTEPRKAQQITIVLKPLSGTYHTEAEFKKVRNALSSAVGISETIMKRNPSKKHDHNNFKRTIDDFVKALVSSELMFPPNACPDMQVLNWISSQITFHSCDELDLKADNPPAGTPHVDSNLLKHYFSHLDSECMEAHIDSVISSLPLTVTADEWLEVVRKMISSYEDFQKVSTCQEKQLASAEMVEKYPTVSKQLRTPSMKAVQEMVALRSLILSSVDQIYQGSGTNTAVLLQMERLLIAADAVGDSQIVNLTIKKLLTVYGAGFVRDFLKSTASGIPEEIMSTFTDYAIPDIFEALSPDTYQNAKNEVTELINDQGSSPAICRKRFKEKTETILQALFTKAVWKSDTSGPSQNVIRDSFQFAMAREPPHVRHFIELMLTNGKWPQEMDVNTVKGLHLSMLVVHTYTSVAFCKPGHDAFPFTKIVTEPKKFTKDLLPAMPSGPLDILLDKCGMKRDSQISVEPSKFCLCARGHVYIIGQYETSKAKQVCPLCAATEGKGGDEDMVYSTLLRSQDLDTLWSKPGHILGPARVKSESVKGVRDLNLLSSTVIQCITHISVLISCLLHPKKIQMAELFQPNIDNAEVVPFLEAHIWTELRLIAEICEGSIENCILLLHKILHDLGQADVRSGLHSLDPVEWRRDWENMIYTNYIKVTFDSKLEVVGKLNELMKIAERKDVWNGSTSEHQLMHPTLWEYQPSLRLENMLAVANANSKGHPALKALVDNCDVLIALKYLPDILKLIRLIADEFHGKIDRELARKETIRNLISKHSDSLQVPKDSMNEMVDSYVSACETCMASKNFGLADVTSICENPSVSEFLLDRYGMLTSRPLNLIRCLVEAHNAVVSKVPVNKRITLDSTIRLEDKQKTMYIREYKVPEAISKYITGEELPLSEVTTYHLVDVSSKEAVRQLLSEHILNVEVGEADDSTKRDAAVFEFVGQKRQIALQIDDLPFYKFNEDFELWKQFELLKHKQERLPEQLKLLMMPSVNLSNESLNEEIKELENVINHISVMPRCDASMALCELIDKLCMKTPNYLKITVGKVREDVKVKHVLHIWLLLKYAQADLFMEQHQLKNPFVAIHNKFVDDELTDAKKIVDTHFIYKEGKTKIFLQHLFDFIMLRLNKGVCNNGARDEDPTKRLDEALKQFVKTQNLSDEVEEELPVLPGNVCVSHAVYLWPLIWKKFNFL